MKTIESLIESVNIQDQREKRASIFEDASDKEVIECVVFAKIAMEFKTSCNEISSSYMNNSRTKIESNYSYEIENDGVINTLRELYKSTSNKFVKSVVATVGQTKKFSDKQLDIIADEILKLKISLTF